MKRSHILWLMALLLLLLSGCKGEPAPTPTPTPVPAAAEPVSTLELNMGYYGPGFWLELARTGEPGELRVDVYKAQGDPEPFQSFTEWSPKHQLTELKAEDVDFDGWTDFHFVVNTGTQGSKYSAYYVWDPETEQFAPDPYGLNELPWASFSGYRKEVYSYTEGRKKRTCYQYGDGGLVWVGEEYIPEGDGSQRYARRRVEVDGDHTFLVELVPREGNFGDIWVNIYQKDGSGEPLQQFEDNAVSFRTMDLMAEDVDFDGKTDFHFVRSYGSLPGEWTNYYIWDPAEERFIPDPYGLNDLPVSDFDGEKGLITSYWHYDAIGGRRAWCRYIDGRLTCVRCLEIGSMAEDGSRPLTVWDLRGGELGKVWEVVDPEGEKSDTSYQRALARWEDLGYPARQEVRADQSHTFWVEAVDTGEPEVDGGKLLVNIYRKKEDQEPVQSFESWWAEPGLLCFSVEDMDFDGDMDFAVCNQEYRSFHWQSHYVWDAEGEKFVEDPYGLNDLSRTEFDPESKTVKAGSWSLMSGNTGYYRYEGENLVCIRTLNWSYNTETEKMDLLVTDGWDGERRVVYDHAAAMDELAEGMVVTEEFLRWEDLSYHGE